ncbi:MAG: tRNA threonylcarbamoyladenosine dehydratase [Paludibacteraceae bacterium]|nr:tRNA threonylcarbamoyladenosine dehydratase [Paludibacteraceae bacterium]
MEDWQTRTRLLLGDDAVGLLIGKHVLVAGLGGVGAYAAEMLCRAGVGRFTIVDADEVKPSNINRQLIATHTTIGQKKCELMRQRLLDINPDCQVEALDWFIEESNLETLFANRQVDFVVDAIDSIAPKTALICHCMQRHISIISSMGAGGRVDPSQITVTDISKTHECALARTIRTRLKKAGIYKGLPVVFSSEPVNRESIVRIDDERNKCSTLGTVSYLPALFGCHLAAYTLKQITAL